MMKKQGVRKGLNLKWKPSKLLNAMNCLIYGTQCLYFERKSAKIYNCQLSLHEQYINIMHIIINFKTSILFEIHLIDNISDEDPYIKKTLAAMGFNHFIVIYVGILTNYVLIMHSENELNMIWEGLQFLIHEAKEFYSRISKMDPFKAEAIMLFLEADTDGSGVLDLEECLQIFSKLRINFDRTEIQSHIREINHDLYEKENLKKVQGFDDNSLTPIGFEYLLRISSLKQGLAPIFNSLCPLFKFKPKRQMNNVMKILKNQNRPLMSDVQLQEFIQTYCHENKSVQECNQIIKSFPVYDGEGKQIAEQCEFLSFHHFCSFLFTSNNSIVNSTNTQVYQDMSLPINEYFIYSSFNTYLASSNVNKASKSKLQMYEICIKKGCRSFELDLEEINGEIVIKHVKNKDFITLTDTLKTIKSIGFSINPYPIILVIENKCSSSMNHQIHQIFNDQIGDCLFTPNKSLKQLPSPMQLKNKILLLSQKSQSTDEFSLDNRINFNLVKVDFNKKGHTCWSASQITCKQIVSYEQIQIQNLTDYARRGLIRSIPQEKTIINNYDPMPMFRSGIQIIAFHVQKQDINHYIIHSKFLENGGNKCGYYLKPCWMRGNTSQSRYLTDFSRPILQMSLKVMSGQKFIAASTDKMTYWIQVYLKGLPIEEAQNKKYRSEPLNDGFFADLELECSFKIFCPDVTLLVFSVVDDVGSILSARAISIGAIRNGLRVVELLGPGMEIEPNSCLLVLCETKKINKMIQTKMSTLLD